MNSITLKFSIKQLIVVTCKFNNSSLVIILIIIIISSLSSQKYVLRERRSSLTDFIITVSIPIFKVLLPRARIVTHSVIAPWSCVGGPNFEIRWGCWRREPFPTSKYLQRTR